MKSKGTLKRLSAALLSSVIAFSGLSLTAAAADPTPHGAIDVLYDYAYMHGLSDSVPLTSTIINSDVVQKVASGLLNFEKEINISEYHLTKQEALAVTIIVRSAYPEIFFAERTAEDGRKCSLTVYSKKDSTTGVYYATRIVGNFLYVDENGDPDKAKLSAAVQQFYSGADHYLDMLSGELSACKDDFSKALLLHDEIALDATYNTTDQNNCRNDIFMRDKNGVCRNYTEVYAYLLAQLGIRSEIIKTPDDQMKHEWLMVYLDGSYYHIDLTWDDPDIPCKVKHKYFLLSDNGINNLSHYGYMQIHNANNSKYDNALMKKYDSKLCKLRADKPVVYGVCNQKGYRKLYSYNYQTNTETELMSFDEKWTIESTTYASSYVGLEAYGDWLFYNTKDAVYRYNPYTGQNHKLRNIVNGKQCFGLRQDNGVLYALTDVDTPENVRWAKLGTMSELATPMEEIILAPDEVSAEVGDEFFVAVSKLPYNSELCTNSYNHSRIELESVTGGYNIKALDTGTTTLKITSSGGIEGTCNITIYNPSSITLDRKSIYVGAGAEFNLKATVQSEYPNEKVTWKSSDNSVATVTDGKVRALKNGKAVITASIVSGKKASCTVFVNSSSVASITLDKTSTSVNKGNTTTLTATIAPDTVTNKKVTWSSSDKTVASVDQNGTVKGLKGGTAVITAKAANGLKATCTVKVVVPVTKITLDTNSVSLKKGTTQTLTATITPSYATYKKVTWSTSDSSVVSVNQSGLIKGLKTGTAAITAKSSNGKTAKCTVTVYVDPTKVTLNKTAVTLKKGGTYTLTATVSPSYASNKTVTFKSSDENVAAVDGSGRITAVGGGTATITASTYNGKTATCKVTVKVSATKITLDKTTATVNVGSFVNLNPFLTPSDSTDKLTWTSSDEGIATVTTAGQVKGIAVGTATVTVKTTSGKTASCTVSVVNPVTDLIFDKNDMTLKVGESGTITATLLPRNATDKTLTWTVYGESGIVSITKTSSGVTVKGLKPGKVSVSARSASGRITNCNVTVTA